MDNSKRFGRTTGKQRPRIPPERSRRRRRPAAPPRSVEFALAAELGAVDWRTTVVTTVHDLQLIRGAMPMSAHDVPVDAMPPWSKQRH